MQKRLTQEYWSLASARIEMVEVESKDQPCEYLCHQTYILTLPWGIYEGDIASRALVER